MPHSLSHGGSPHPCCLPSHCCGQGALGYDWLSLGCTGRSPEGPGPCTSGPVLCSLLGPQSHALRIHFEGFVGRAGGIGEQKLLAGNQTPTSSQLIPSLPTAPLSSPLCSAGPKPAGQIPAATCGPAHRGPAHPVPLLCEARAEAGGAPEVTARMRVYAPRFPPAQARLSHLLLGPWDELASVFPVSGVRCTGL